MKALQEMSDNELNEVAHMIFGCSIDELPDDPESEAKVEDDIRVEME